MTEGRAFSDLLLDRVGKSRGLYALSDDERLDYWARTLPAILSCKEIAQVVIRGDRFDEPTVRDEAERSIRFALIDACRRGMMKARSHGTGSMNNYDGTTEHMLTFYVHRDDARRYLAALNLLPPDGSPLALWLKGADVVAKPETLSAQDMADFQQMCLEQWERNPTQTITGANGVVQEVGKSYLVSYKVATLEKWARAVAPDGVKGVRGRRKKSSSE